MITELSELLATFNLRNGCYKDQLEYCDPELLNKAIKNGDILVIEDKLYARLITRKYVTKPSLNNAGEKKPRARQYARPNPDFVYIPFNKGDQYRDTKNKQEAKKRLGLI